jgi:hypothetical protein
MGHPSPAQIAVYDAGDMVTLTATILGTDGVTPVQPSYFAFLVRNPAGSAATYVFGAAGASVISPGNGAFSKDVTVDFATWAVGSWWYRAVATGKVQAADEWSFLVAASFFL